MDSAAETDTEATIINNEHHVHDSLHSAAAEGNIQAVQLLISRGSDITAVDERGDSALNYAIEAGHLIIAEYLINSINIDLKARNLNGDTALHVAAKHDDHQVAELLVATGADINAQDSSGCTALHVACQRHSVNTALSLMQCQASLDIVDNAGETALHKCCRENLLPVVQTMCAVGSSKDCPVNAFNKAGQSALHLAARVGNAELVRCLLLSGADIELVNKDGVRAEDIALAQGNTELADFLSKLSASMTFSKHDPFFSQLLPSDRAIWRIKVKLFGNCGVGKSTLIESLKCGYIRGLFRHLTSTASGGSAIMPTIAEHVADNIDVEAAGGTGKTLVIHENCTRCVNIANVNVSGAGDLSLWEFSGYEPYYIVYDHFVGDPNCIHVVMFRACDPINVQQQQLRFWLDFLRARIAPAEPIGFAGTQLWAPRVLLVATHVDRVNSSRRNSRGETEYPGESGLVTSLQKEFGAELLIAPHIFTLDARMASGADIKSFKTVLGEMKQFLCQYLPPSLGFLEPTVSALPTWTRLLGGFPVVRWATFVEYVRSRVHILATENHLQELICQLQLMGEVVYIESDSHDLIVLDPVWLFRDVIGRLLSPIKGVARRDGVLTVDDATALFPGLDTADLTSLLVAMELCSPTADDNTGYHLACLNERPAPSDDVVEDLTTDSSVRCGGMELRAANSLTAQLQHVFHRVQQALWNRHHQMADDRSGAKLTEWSMGTSITLPATVVVVGSNADSAQTDRDVTTSPPGGASGGHCVKLSLAERGRVIRIICVGYEPEVLYRLQNDVLFVALKVIEACCPGMYLERAPVSPESIRSKTRDGSSSWRSYHPRDVIGAMMLSGVGEVRCDDDDDVVNKTESLADLIAFGSSDLYEALRPVGPDLHVSHLPIYARCRLATMLDPVHPLGRDWCLLAVGLGLADAVPQVDSSQTVTLSRTDAVLAVWSHDADATVRRLRDCLTDVLQRPDVAEQLLTLTPIVGSVSPHRRQSSYGESSSPPGTLTTTTTTTTSAQA